MYLNAYRKTGSPLKGQVHRCCMVVVSSYRETFPSVGKRAQPPFCVTSVAGNCPAQSASRNRGALCAGRKVGTTSNQHGPLMPWATHVLQWPVQWVAKPQGGANPQNWSQFGLRAATRPHEAGIASNRGSAIPR